MPELRPRAIAVEPLADYELLVTFDNRERKIFDVKPYIKGSWFGKLANPEAFKAVQIGGLSIEWPGGQDICPDRLYEDSRPAAIQE